MAGARRYTGRTHFFSFSKVTPPVEFAPGGFFLHARLLRARSARSCRYGAPGRNPLRTIPHPDKLVTECAQDDCARSRRPLYSRASRYFPSLYNPMFEHLVQPEPESAPGDMVKVDDASPAQLLEAQASTAKWLEGLGARDEEIVAAAQADAARKAFQALALTPDSDQQKRALVEMKTPAAVRHLAGMLTAYDWEFVEQAKELRGFVVSKLVEHSNSTNAHISLKALGMLGKVTEVGLFTEKIEVHKPKVNETELEDKIRDRLKALTDVFLDAETREVTDVEPREP